MQSRAANLALFAFGTVACGGIEEELDSTDQALTSQCATGTNPNYVSGYLEDGDREFTRNWDYCSSDTRMTTIADFPVKYWIPGQTFYQFFVESPYIHNGSIAHLNIADCFKVTLAVRVQAYRNDEWVDLTYQEKHPSFVNGTCWYAPSFAFLRFENMSQFETKFRVRAWAKVENGAYVPVTIRANGA